jgi:hypothetical protein
MLSRVIASSERSGVSLLAFVLAKQLGKPVAELFYLEEAKP